MFVTIHSIAGAYGTQVMFLGKAGFISVAVIAGVKAVLVCFRFLVFRGPFQKLLTLFPAAGSCR